MGDLLAVAELSSFLDGLGSFQVAGGPGLGPCLLLLKLGSPAGLDGLAPYKVGKLSALTCPSGHSEDLAI